MENSENVLGFDEWTDGSVIALQVVGHGMINEQINDGDFVIIKIQKQAENGQIIAFRDKNDEMTLRKIYREKNRIRLVASNKAFKPIYCKTIDIVGVLVGIVRKY